VGTRRSAQQCAWHGVQYGSDMDYITTEEEDDR
jgi:hypothetical protein